MTSEISKLLVLTDDMFQDASIESNRAPMKAYMKGHFEFYGVKSPARKVILKTIKKEIKEFSYEDVFDYAERLWMHDKRESQYLALDVLDYKKKHGIKEYLSRIEKLIITKSWWDTVDGLAPNIAGNIFYNNNDIRLEWIEKWNNSTNMWLNRSALIHQLRYKTEMNMDLLFALVESHIGSKEFFINKASGWALRQASKFYPAEVKSFIDSHPNLSNLTKREGKKYL